MNMLEMLMQENNHHQKNKQENIIRKPEGPGYTQPGCGRSHCFQQAFKAMRQEVLSSAKDDEIGKLTAQDLLTLSRGESWLLRNKANY